MRDMIFTAWKALVMRRIKKAKVLVWKCSIKFAFNTWLWRFRRYNELGYFYDSESDDDAGRASPENEEVSYEAADGFDSGSKSPVHFPFSLSPVPVCC